LPACIWRGIKVRGPDKQAALKCLYLVTWYRDLTACQEDLAIYRETGDQYRQGIALKKIFRAPGPRSRPDARREPSAAQTGLRAVGV
jgi:hypothetical protein